MMLPPGGILIAHDPARGLGGEEQTLQIRVEHQIPGLFGDLERRLPDVDARVVDEDVEPAIARLHRRINAVGDALPSCERRARRRGHRPPAPCSSDNGRFGAFQAVRELGDDDPRARGGQCPRGRLPDPGAGAGDERGHPGESCRRFL